MYKKIVLRVYLNFAYNYIWRGSKRTNADFSTKEAFAFKLNIIRMCVNVWGGGGGAILDCGPSFEVLV